MSDLRNGLMRKKHKPNVGQRVYALKEQRLSIEKLQAAWRADYQQADDELGPAQAQPDQPSQEVEK